MVDAVQAGRGVVDYPGIYPIANNYVLANISGSTALPYPVALADLAAAMGAPTYQGTWNASTNTPTIVSSVGTNGQYYVVSVAGTTSINGISDWSVGDWIIFNGTAGVWQKIEGGATTLTVGSTILSGGTTGRILYDNAGVLGEFATSISGSNITFPGTITTASNGASITVGSGSTESGLYTAGTSPFALVSLGSYADFYAGGSAGANKMLRLTTSGVTIGNATNSGIVSLTGSSASLSIAGATIGSDALAVTGSATISSTLTSGGTIVAGASGYLRWSARTVMASPADGQIVLWNNATTDFSRLMFGGTTSSFPALKRSSATMAVRLADDSADAALTSLSISTSTAATFHTTTVALTNGAGASAGTITNAPAVGNPTKWIGINDNGTIRYIPAW